jgi:hypothetical protein
MPTSIQIIFSKIFLLYVPFLSFLAHPIHLTLATQVKQIASYTIFVKRKDNHHHLFCEPTSAYTDAKKKRHC